MARTYVEVVKDDLTGEITEDGQFETIEFGVNGKSYSIDLNPKNAAEFHATLTKYIAAATRIPVPAKARRSGSGRSDTAQLASIRAWAKQNGYQVAPRGRISAEVLEAYNNR
ncbi:MAG: Lsr2 family protein [Propionicimonas sp.]